MTSCTSVERSSSDSKHDNGTAFRSATLNLTDIDTIYFPTRTKVVHANRSTLLIHIDKMLSFHGFSDETLSINTARNNMGCAFRRNRSSVFVATFGEFDSDNDGGTFVELTAFVPDALNVKYDDTYERLDEWGQATSSKLWLKDGRLVGGSGKQTDWKLLKDRPRYRIDYKIASIASFAVLLPLLIAWRWGKRKRQITEQ